MDSVSEEVRVTILGGVREVRVGIGVMNSSCASISCHLKFRRYHFQRIHNPHPGTPESGCFSLG